MRMFSRSLLFLKKIVSIKSHDRLDGWRYYPLSPTCQIPKLDIIYENYFGQTKNGRFVEVGAYDGEYASNTSGLADIGWQGYYIEPVPQYYEKCKSRHEKNREIVVSNCAIGAKNAIVEINIGGPLSTIKESAKANFEMLKWAKGYFTGGKVKVYQFMLDEYLEEHGVYPGFELLVIDVEGYEWEVLKGFSIEKWNPKMIIIELHDQNDEYAIIQKECRKIVNYFFRAFYKAIYKDFSNTIYVPRTSYPNFTQNFT